MTSINNYDYSLPKELIAQRPTDKREESRLLVVNREQREFADSQFHNIANLLRAGDLLIFNDTKVIPARLHGVKQSGARIEIFLLEERGRDVWLVLAKPAKRLKLHAIISLSDRLQGEVIEEDEAGKRLIKFSGVTNIKEELFKLGKIPLPPYIAYHEEDHGFYEERYQTVFAQKSGAVAAPTAGLHFSRELMQILEDKGVKTAFVTLHVGMGTFKSVDVENLDDHQMHSEEYEMTQEVVDQIAETKKRGGRVVAVGTTVTRVLEGLFSLGPLKASKGKINIFIRPGFEFKVVDVLVTNFHLPKSTLLVLVSAFAGKELIQRVYAHAVENKYRFYSFGDAMIIC